MSDSTPKSYSTDPILYLYTSLTSGSSHIVTATSRLETILKANRIPFKALDIATDEKARMLWGRRAGKDESGRQRKIPGLVQMGLVIGDLVEIEDWNEYGELKEHVKIVPIDGTPVRSAAPTPSGTPSKTPKSENTKLESSSETSKAPKPEQKAKPEPSSETSKPPAGATPTAFTLAIRQAGEEAAQKAKDSKKKVTEISDGTGKAESTTKGQIRAAAIPHPIVVQEDKSKHEDRTETTATMQSPTSTAWKSTPVASTKQSSPRHSIATQPMQSPRSTAWKSTDIDQPITTHRGSSISSASAEEIREIERSQAIEEEDEEDDEDES